MIVAMPSGGERARRRACLSTPQGKGARRSARSNIAPGEIGGQGAQVVVALARVLGEVRGMAQQQQLPPMKMKEIDATDQ